MDFLRKLASVKLLSIFVFAGMLVLFVLGKMLFYGVFEMEFLQLLWLVIMAVVVAIVKMTADTLTKNGIVNHIVEVVVVGVVVVGLMFFFNWAFSLFALNGIQYLYFGLIMSALYVLSCLGFWVVDKFEINSLNMSLEAFKKDI